MSIIAHLHFSGSNVAVFYVFMFQDWLGNLLFAYSIFSILSIIHVIIQILFFYQYFSPKSVGKPVKSRSMLLYQRLPSWSSGGRWGTGPGWQLLIFWHGTLMFYKFVESGQAEVDGVQDQTNSTGCSVFSKFFYIYFIIIIIIFLLLVYSVTRYDLVESSCCVPRH